MQPREFLIHTNPLAQSWLSDQKTSRCMFCVYRGVNVNSLAVQYPLYFHGLARQNELTECPKTPRVCVCVHSCLIVKKISSFRARVKIHRRSYQLQLGGKSWSFY